jgi:hypothetical protein
MEKFGLHVLRGPPSCSHLEHTVKHLPTFILILAATGSLALAGCQHHDRHTSSAPKPYILDTCVVGGEKLGSMGPVTSVVKDGYEVKFCCPKCQVKFEDMPSKYMKEVKSSHVTMPEISGG